MHIWNSEILALNFEISYQGKPKCKRPTTPLITVQHISGASWGAVDARWLLDFYIFLKNLISTTRSHLHIHTHPHTHTLSSEPSKGLVLSLCGAAAWQPAGPDLLAGNAGQWSLSMGLGGWVEPCGASAELWAVAVGGQPGKRGTEPHSGLTPVPLQTADRHTLSLQAFIWASSLICTALPVSLRAADHPGL